MSKRESKSTPHGIVVEKVEMLNQDGDVVIDGEHATLLIGAPPRRKPRHGPLPATNRKESCYVVDDGRQIAADVACASGMAAEVTPDGKTVETALALANDIAAMSPLAVG